MYCLLCNNLNECYKKLIDKLRLYLLNVKLQLSINAEICICIQMYVDKRICILICIFVGNWFAWNQNTGFQMMMQTKQPDIAFQARKIKTHITKSWHTFVIQARSNLPLPPIYIQIYKRIRSSHGNSTRKFQNYFSKAFVSPTTFLLTNTLHSFSSTFAKAFNSIRTFSIGTKIRKRTSAIFPCFPVGSRAFYSPSSLGKFKCGR